MNGGISATPTTEKDVRKKRLSLCGAVFCEDEKGCTCEDPFHCFRKDPQTLKWHHEEEGTEMPKGSVMAPKRNPTSTPIPFSQGTHPTPDLLPLGTWKLGPGQINEIAT